MREIAKRLALVFDIIENFWESKRLNRWMGNIIVFSFVFSLTLIHFKVIGLLPQFIAPYISNNHFEAIEVAFVLLLFFEVQSLVLVLPRPFAGSLLKQFEILSLILLRQAFKEFKYIEEPINLDSYFK